MDMEFRPRLSMRFAFAFFLSIALLFSLETAPVPVGVGASAFTYGAQPVLPGQGMPSYRLVGGCEGCPPPDSLVTMVLMGYDPEQKLASATLAAESEDDTRFPVTDATIFVQVFYKEGGEEQCRIKTDEKGESNFSFGEDTPYAECIDKGCTIRFTFCCPNLTLGACLIPICLTDDSLAGYEDVDVCPGYSDSDWPEEAKVIVGSDEVFYPLYPSIGEINIPPKPPNLFGAFSFGFCLPVLVIFGLLSAAMFAAGRNPLAMFSFYTPQFKRGTERMIRGRGLSWNISGIVSSATSFATGVHGDIGVAKAAVKGKDSSVLKNLSGVTMVKKTGSQYSAMGGKSGAQATKGGGKVAVMDSKGRAQTLGGSFSDTQLGKTGGTFAGLAQSSKSGWGKAGWSIAGTVVILSAGIGQRLAQSVGPLNIVMSGGFGFAGAVELMGAAINQGGAPRVSKFLKEEIDKMNIQETVSRDGTKVLVTFVDSDGKTQRREFDLTADGLKSRAEFYSNLLGEKEIAFAMAAGLAFPKMRGDAVNSADAVAHERIDSFSEDVQDGKWGKEAKKTLETYDSDKDGKISSKELNKAIESGKLTTSEMGVLILSCDQGTGIPRAYEQNVMARVNAGTLTSGEAAVAALVLNREGGELSSPASVVLQQGGVAPTDNLATSLAKYQDDKLGTVDAAKASISGNPNDAKNFMIFAAAMTSAVAPTVEVSMNGEQQVLTNKFGDQLVLSGVTALSNISEAYPVVWIEGAQPPAMKEVGALQQKLGEVSAEAVAGYENNELANKMVLNRVMSNEMYGLSGAEEGGRGPSEPNNYEKMKEFAIQGGYLGKPEDAEEQLTQWREGSPMAISEKRDSPEDAVVRGLTPGLREQFSEQAEKQAHKIAQEQGLSQKEEAELTTKLTAELYIKSTGLTPEEYYKNQREEGRRQAIDAFAAGIVFSGGIPSSPEEIQRNFEYAKAQASEAYDSKDPSKFYALLNDNMNSMANPAGSTAETLPGLPEKPLGDRAQEWEASGGREKFEQSQKASESVYEEPMKEWEKAKYDAGQKAEKEWIGKKPTEEEAETQQEMIGYRRANFFEQKAYEEQMAREKESEKPVEERLEDERKKDQYHKDVLHEVDKGIKHEGRPPQEPLEGAEQAEREGRAEREEARKKAGRRSKKGTEGSDYEEP